MRPAAEATCLIIAWRAAYAEWRSCVPVIGWGADAVYFLSSRTVAAAGCSVAGEHSSAGQKTETVRDSKRSLECLARC